MFWHTTCILCLLVVEASDLVNRALDLRTKGLGVRFPLLVLTLCRSVEQTSHSILPLPTQQWWVPSGQEIWLSGSSCLHACMACAPYSPRGDEIAQVVSVLYWRYNWPVEYGIYQKFNYVPLALPSLSTGMGGPKFPWNPCGAECAHRCP